MGNGNKSNLTNMLANALVNTINVLADAQMTLLTYFFMIRCYKESIILKALSQTLSAILMSLLVRSLT